MSDKIYFTLIAIITILLLTVEIGILALQNKSELFTSIYLGASLNLVSVFGSFFMTKKAINTSAEKFGNFIIGNMAIRIIFLISSLLVAILIFKINKISLAISTISFYLAYLILELFHFGKYSTTK